MSRVIKPEEIRIGDTIRVSLVFNYDMKVTREGTVARIREEGSAREYGTEEHAVLLLTPNLRESKVIVELLHRVLPDLPCEIEPEEVQVDDKIRVDFEDGSVTGLVIGLSYNNIDLYFGGVEVEVQDPEKITLLERGGE